MSMIQSDLLLGQEGGAGYAISRSLRFSSIDSAFLSRTPASAGNRKTWTWAGWVKRTVIGETQALFGNYTDGSNFSAIRISNDYIQFVNTGSGGTNPNVTTPNLLRDPSAWYHIVFALDTTQATSSNRVRVYINGVQLTTSGTYPDQNADLRVNTASLQQNLGALTNSGGTGLDGYLADVIFVDGQALDPSSFTEVSATTGQLVPKAYSGSFGTNGFWLKFSDNSAATATTLGKDYSGNSNNWTPNNLSVATGAGNDSLVDTPTSYGTDTGAGGEVRGNYCTLNPLAKGGDIQAPTNGNLQVTSSGSGYGLILGTIGMSSGKWYWEVTTTSANCATGIATNQANLASYGGADAYSWVWASYSGGSNKRNNGSQSSYGSILANGDVVGIAFDADNGTLTFYKNNVSQGAAYTGLVAGTYLPVLGDETASANIDLTVNFGQRPFAYTAPSGFKALCDTNLPAPVVAKSSDYFQTVLYTGNGSTQTISGLGFSPDLVWIKDRTLGASHFLHDAVRGTGKTLFSNLTIAEVSNYAYGYLSAFNSDGFTVQAGSSGNDISSNTAPYAAWCWDAGTSTVTNTQGSITSQVRANPSAGFSIVTYTGNGSSGATVGHGLGVAPSFIIIKDRTAARTSDQWPTYHSSIGATGGLLYLNSTSAGIAASVVWNNTNPSSTVFTLGNWGGINYSGDNFVAYCFAPVAGYSSFGSYVGTGAVSTGPFCYTGFRPRLVILKAAVGGTSGWIMVDTARNTYNAVDYFLQANSSGAESTQVILDAVSNGFVIRPVGDAMNNSGVTFVWAAFAESPFQYARAR